LKRDDTPTVAGTKPTVFYGYVIVATALCMCIMMWGARFSFSVFFAPVLDEFGWSRATTAGGFSLSWVFTGLLSIAVGKLNDRLGPRMIMTVAGCLVGLGYLLMSTLSSVWQLYLFYGVISIGMSAVLVPTLSTVAKWFVKMRAFMTGIVLSSSGIALMVIVPVANRIILDYGWRTAYTIIGSVTIVVVVLSAQLLRRDPGQMGKVPYGSDGKRSTLLKSGAQGLIFKEALHTYQVWLLCFVYFCTYFIYNVLVVHMVIYAKGQGISQAQAVAIIAFLGGAGIVGRILWGVFADILGNRKAMVLSAGLMMLALFWLQVAGDAWILVLVGIAFGFSHGGLATMESPMVANIFGMRSHGTILGLVFFADTVGGATGPFLAGYLFDVTRNYHVAFLLCAILGIANLAAILLLRPLRSQQSAT
jgi:MFS family permease